jgi:lipopolysaccharide transport system permease protein
MIRQYDYSASPLMIVGSLVRHRDLIVQLTRRAVIGRYRGSVIGVLWALLHPLVMLGVYTLVFQVVFPTRWELPMAGHGEFALFLFAGLIVYGLFADCANHAPSLVLNHINYVKKIVFPLEILPWVSLGSALFHTGVSVGMLVLCYAMFHFSVNWTLLLFPLLLFPLGLMALGLSWFLASVGVFLRDVGQVIGVLTSMMLFLSPVFYPITALPAAYQPLMYLNPLTFQVEQARNVLIMGKPLAWQGLVIYFLCSVLVAWFGLWWFQKTRKGFADVL